MFEVALLALDLFLITYCCWVVVRASRKSQVKASDLGVFAYKKNGEKGAP